MFYFFLIIQVLNTPIKAQKSQLRFQHYTTNDGLSQGVITCIAQDTRGFMWFGTYDGLNRFDGYNFKVFKPISNDTTSISDNRINSIIEDRNGMLWIGTNECMNSYDFKTNRFEHIYLYDSLRQKLKGYYYPFFIDNKDELWFLYASVLSSINLLTKKITTYPFSKNAMDGLNTGNYPYKKINYHLTKVYSYGNTGLHIIDVDKKKVDFYFSSDQKNEFGRPLIINKVLEDKNHILWLSTSKGLISFNPLTKENHLYDEYNRKKIISLKGIDWDKEGNLWCASAGMGLSLFNTTENLFISNYYKNPINPESIGRNFATTLFIDKDNNIWTGITPDGVDKANPSYQKFNCIKINLPQDESYSSSIGTIYEIDTNNLVISSNLSDIIHYNKMTGVSQKIDLPERLKESTNMTMILDSYKRIWVVSDSGLYRSDEKLKSFTLIEKKNFDNATLFEFNKKIYIGTIGGLYSIPITGQLNRVDTFKPFNNSIINFIGKSPDSLLCVTTYGKDLFLINVNTVKPFVVKKLNFNFLIKSVLFEGKDTLWLGTSAGLVRYSNLNGILKIYTEKDGLANSFVYHVLKGNDGNLWMSTNHGISRFDILTERFTNYGLTEGAQSLEFNTHSFFQSPSGTIYFGGVKGFNYFNPSAIKKFDFEPPIEVLDISANGNPVSLDRVVEQKEPIKFSSNENNISIEFAAIDFNRNDNINYLYQLHDNDAWISIGKQRTLSFANLSPGSYYLQVKAQYSYNEVSPHILKFAFTVLPPFYTAWWFIIIIGVFVIFIIYSIYRYRINQLLKLQAIRNNIARDLHDEVGATLSGIAMYSHLTKEQIKNSNTVEVVKSLNIMQQSSSEMVNKLNDIVWLINPDQDSLQKLIQRLEEYATDMVKVKNMQVKVNVPEHLHVHSLPMKSRRNIYLFCKEAINNAVKYSNGTLLELNVKEINNKLEFAVCDNGKGFNLSTVKRGNGLENMQKRADEIGAKLTTQSKHNEGSLVSMQVKIT